MQVSTEDLAYAAALIDGEGSIGFNRPRTTAYRCPWIEVASSTPELLAFMKERFGGNISEKKVTQEGYKRQWKWDLRYDKALEIMRAILPYMREPLKRRRAEHLVYGYKHVVVRNGRYTTEQKAARTKFEEEFFSFK